MFLGDDVIVCTFKDTAVPWYNLQLEKCCTRTMWGKSAFAPVQIQKPQMIFSKLFYFFTSHFENPKSTAYDFIYHFLHNTHRVPKFDVRLKHNTILMHYNVSITCIACTSSISTHAQPVTMATEATWCLSECVLELQHQSLPSQ